MIPPLEQTVARHPSWLYITQWRRTVAPLQQYLARRNIPHRGWGSAAPLMFYPTDCLDVAALRHSYVPPELWGLRCARAVRVLRLLRHHPLRAYWATRLGLCGKWSSEYELDAACMMAALAGLGGDDDVA